MCGECQIRCESVECCNMTNVFIDLYEVSAVVCDTSPLILSIVEQCSITFIIYLHFI